MAGTEGGSGGTRDNAGDRALADAIARAGAVDVPCAFVFEPAHASTRSPPAAVETSAYRIVRSDSAWRDEAQIRASDILAALERYLEAGRPGHVTVLLDADGSLRFAHSAIRYGGSYYPSLAIEAARLYLGAGRDRLTLDLGHSVSIGDRRLRTDDRSRFAVKYAGPPRTFPTWSLIDVLESGWPDGRFRDKTVLLRATAAGLGDRFATPYGANVPGVEVFATIIENILGRGFLRHSARIEALDLLAILLAGASMVLCALPKRPATVLTAAVLVLAGWLAVNFHAFAAFQTWLNVTFPTLAILAGGNVVLIGRATRENRLRNRADTQRDRLARYVSPLAAAGLDGKIGSGTVDRDRLAAVLFVDLVGFTKASEELAPAEAARLLARFHRCIERAADAHHGTIDKFVGDGALVVFGVPQSGPEDAANAVRCAHRIVAGLRSTESAEDGAGESPAARGIGVAVGVHFGPVVVAEVGGSDHAQITVAGDTVNVASRLEALTRELGTEIVISDAVMAAARAAGAGDDLAGFVARPGQTIRGWNRPLDIWLWRGE